MKIISSKEKVADLHCSLWLWAWSTGNPLPCCTPFRKPTLNQQINWFHKQIFDIPQLSNIEKVILNLAWFLMLCTTSVWNDFISRYLTFHRFQMLKKLSNTLLGFWCYAWPVCEDYAIFTIQAKSTKDTYIQQKFTLPKPHYQIISTLSNNIDHATGKPYDGTISIIQKTNNCYLRIQTK